MNEVIHQMFGLFGDKYYAVEDCDRIVIPVNTDYKSSSVVTKIHEAVNEAEIDAYFYHTNLMTDSNSERVKFMKEYLLGEKVLNIEQVKPNYVIGINYCLYDKKGKLIKSGNSEVESQWCIPIILNEVSEGNYLEYRKGLIMDGRIEICIPDTIRYGIRNGGTQYPYTLRINNIFALATNGGYKYITETGTQLDSADDCHCGATTSNHHHAKHGQYFVHHHNGLCDANFNSCFVTNAKIGTTIIDNVVASAKLEAPPEYEKIDICNIPLQSSQYTIKMNHKLNHIIVNVELFVDNMNEVYDREDISKLLEYNAGINYEEDEEDAGNSGSDHWCNCCDHCVTSPKDEEDTSDTDKKEEDNTEGNPQDPSEDQEAASPLDPTDQDNSAESAEDHTNHD